MAHNDNIINIDYNNDIVCYHNYTTNFLTGENPPYHRHNNMYEIYLFIKGNVLMCVDDICYKMSPGDLVTVSPGQLHRSIITEGPIYERISINITRDVIKSLSSKDTDLLEVFTSRMLEKSKIIHLSSYNLIEYTKLIDRYIETQKSNDYGSDLMSIYRLTEILIYLNKLFHDSKFKHYDNIMPQIISNTMQYIDKHLTEEITLQKLSSSLNYSGNYLSSQFKLYTKISLREYILDQRIECAKKHLRAGKNVSEACIMSGFNDYSNFIRSFTKKVGVSPGKYRSDNYYPTNLTAVP